MIGLRTNSTFDIQAILRPTKKASLRVLAWFGGYVRKKARYSVKEKPKTERSLPGRPPYSHMKGEAWPGIRFILYDVDSYTDTVIIGPASNRPRGLTIPEILEWGYCDVAARPFMGPAFEKGKERLDEFWANSVKP